MSQSFSNDFSASTKNGTRIYGSPKNVSFFLDATDVCPQRGLKAARYAVLSNSCYVPYVVVRPRRVSDVLETRWALPPCAKTFLTRETPFSRSHEGEIHAPETRERRVRHAGLRETYFSLGRPHDGTRPKVRTSFQEKQAKNVSTTRFLSCLSSSCAL